MRIKTVSSIVLALICLTMLTACGDEAPQGGKNTVTLPLGLDPENLNPYLGQTAETGLVTKAIYQGLVDLSPSSEYVPVLATEVPTVANGGVSADGREVTWKLRKGVSWSDGKPFTATDVKFTAEMLQRSLADTGVGWDLLSAVTVVDPHTVRFSYRTFYPAYLDHMSGAGTDGGTRGILASHACDTGKMPLLADLTCTNKPVGTGPYMLDSWRRGQEVTLRVNPHFTHGTKPRVTKIVLPVVPSEVVRNRMMVSHQAQALWAADFHSADSLRKAGVSLTPATPWVTRIHVNLSRPVLADVRVRRAISLAVDRKAIAKDIFGGESQPVTSNLFRSQPPPTDSYDLDAAAALLTEAGWTAGAAGQPRTCTACPGGGTGKTLRVSMLILPEYAAYVALAQYIQGQLKKIGIAVETVVAADTAERILKGTYDLALRDDGFVGDPGTYLQRCYLSSNKPAADGTWDGGWNVERYASPAFDAAIKKAQLEPDNDKREKLLLAADAILQADLPAIFLATYPYPDAYSANLRGWTSNLNVPMTWDANKWYLQ